MAAMNAGRLVFSQIAELVHREQFAGCVSIYPMPRASRSFAAWDQLGSCGHVALRARYFAWPFAQLTFRESPRDIEACLGSQANLLYAMGIRRSVTRTNLAYANEHRSSKVYFELDQILIRKAASCILR